MTILYHMQNLMQIVHLSLLCATKWQWYEMVMPYASYAYGTK